MLSGTACSNSCTDIGCLAGVSATLTPRQAPWQSGDYTLDLTIDRRDEHCAFSLVPSDSTRSLSCGGGVRMELATTALRVLVDAAPKTLSLSLSRGGTVLLAVSPMLNYRESEYRESEPNGPDCGVCRSASIELTVVN